MNRHVIFTLLLLHSWIQSSAFQNTNDTCVSVIHQTATDAANAHHSRLLVVRTKGQAPFQYKWSDGSSSKQIRVVHPGTYCVTVEDANGCISSTCTDLLPMKCKTRIEIQRSDSLSNVQSPTLIAHTRGVEPFTYEWSTGDTTQSIEVDSATIYCVLVSDSLGCQSRACVDLRKDCKFKVKIRRGLSASFDGLGLYAQVRGNRPVSYLWSTGDTTRYIIPDTSGQYCVRVTDDHGCTSGDCIDVIVPGDTCSAAIRVLPTGVLMAWSRPFRGVTYEWSTGDTVPVIQVDSSGEYCVAITDVFGCQSRACVQYEKPTDRPCIVKIRRRNSDHGLHLTAKTRPNHSGFSYQWSTGDTTRTIIVETPGVYIVSVSNGSCTASDTVNVESVDPPSIAGNREMHKVTPRIHGLRAYPNPFVNDLEVNIPLDTADDIVVSIYRLDGKLMLQKLQRLTAGDHKMRLSLQGIEAGIYLLRINGSDFLQTIKVVKKE